jgi:hypothetical protein
MKSLKTRERFGKLEMRNHFGYKKCSITVEILRSSPPGEFLIMTKLIDTE